MSQPVGVVVAVLLGTGVAVQVAMIGAIGRARGPVEAAFISLLATVCGMTGLLAGRSLGGRSTRLPAPLDQPVLLAGISVLAAVLLAVGSSGLPRYYALAGLLAVPFLVGGAYLGPRLGLGLYLACTIAGQLVAAAWLDHAGAFGAVERPVNLTRVAGIAVLLAGVVLMRRGE